MVLLLILSIHEKIDQLIQTIRNNANNVKFSDLCKVCEHYFGEARQMGTSHRIYKTPWVGDPRVNIQDNKGMAKVYQVRQVLKAIDKLNKKEK